MPTYGLYVRDASRQRVAEVDDYAQLEVVLRFNAVGGWRLTLATQSAAAQLLILGRGGFILMRDGVTLLSGPVRRLERQWGVDGDTLVASGPDDLTLLADRLAYPVPSMAVPDGSNHYGTQVADVRSGVAESVIKAYILNNIGSSAPAVRQIPGFINATDAGRGASVTGRARFDNLLELCQTLAQAGGLGLTLLQQVAVGGFPLQFDVYDPADLTNTAVFNPNFGTLSAFNYTLASASANYIIAGGGGEGTARTFREAGDSLSIAQDGRIEEFLDQRQTTVTAELDQAVAAELATKAQHAELQLTPIDTGAMAYVTDYNLGDTVSVVVDDIRIADIIRTITIMLTKDKGETITPFVGSPTLASHHVPELFRRLAENQSRIHNLERV
jgi:hypothetical protein